MPATPTITIDATGAHLPDFATILAFFQASYRGIYGDAVLDPDTQDGQWVAIIAKALADANAAALAVYNAFSPLTAQGTGLSTVVKINGITRAVASYSTADLQIVGQQGTVLTNCIARDANSNQWAIDTVTIPAAGVITTSATCTTIGAIAAPAGTINQLATPIPGWQSVTNPAAATPGNPVESDAALRVRQSKSTMNPSVDLTEGTLGALLALAGVARVKVYENDTDFTDANSVPPHMIAYVIDGGDAQQIANTIGQRKGQGAGTYGFVTEAYTNRYGITRPINFFRPIQVPISYRVRLHQQKNYTLDIQASIQKALADWTNALDIGQPLQLVRAYLPAQLNGGADSQTFEIVSVEVARNGIDPAAADVAIAFNEVANCVVGNITVLVI